MHTHSSTQELAATASPAAASTGMPTDWTSVNKSLQDKSPLEIMDYVRVERVKFWWEIAKFMLFFKVLNWLAVEMYDPCPAGSRYFWQRHRHCLFRGRGRGAGRVRPLDGQALSRFQVSDMHVVC